MEGNHTSRIAMLKKEFTKEKSIFYDEINKKLRKRLNKYCICRESVNCKKEC